MGKVEKLVTLINTDFYDPNSSKELLLKHSVYKDVPDSQKKDAINKACKAISEKSLYSAALQDGQRFFHVAFSDYDTFKRSEKNNLVYRIEQDNDDYYISTGLYCGVINFGDNRPKIEIQTEYSDRFFKRIINYCCGIYADTFSSESTESKSIYSLLVQYLFLASLRKVAGRTIPQKYVYLTNRDYSINGNVDINAYINHDLISYDKKITYNYPAHLEIQAIIDVLHSAIKCCRIKNSMNELPQIVGFKNHLCELYSGKKPSKRVIKTIQNDKCLSNSLYSGFKRPLEYARILLETNDVNSGGEHSTAGVSGFLVDASFLWEMYLYNLMTLNLENWEIDAQRQISFYDATFYPKNNYPDFVLTNKITGEIFVLDAKFKRMQFDGKDVDNDDLRQLHAYAYYFQLTAGDKFKGAGLIYPTKTPQPDGIKTDDHIFGITSAKQRFGVFSIKDPDQNETIVDNERMFILALKKFLND